MNRPTGIGADQLSFEAALKGGALERPPTPITLTLNVPSEFLALLAQEVAGELHPPPIGASEPASAVPERSGESPLLSVNDAAAYLAVHPRTIYRAIASGGLEARKAGAQWRIAPAALDAWLKTREALCEKSVVPAPVRPAARLSSGRAVSGRAALIESSFTARARARASRGSGAPPKPNKPTGGRMSRSATRRDG